MNKRINNWRGGANLAKKVRRFRGGTRLSGKIRKNSIFLALLTIAILLLSMPAFADDMHPSHGKAAGSLQSECPVMKGNAINKKHFVDYQGQRIYFCCNSCPTEFLKDPENYLKMAKMKGTKFEKTPNPQTTCPVTGDKINRKYFVDYQGKRIFFCCSNCPAQFNKNPDKYMQDFMKKKINLEDAPSS